ncbi:MAG: hypothetical protein KBD24_01990 [Candidatus Pacebacteria bacterium]|nr:hypothetical protein [Candidatus Paceibacterota bacterium]
MRIKVVPICTAIIFAIVGLRFIGEDGSLIVAMAILILAGLIGTLPNRRVLSYAYKGLLQP